MRRSSPFAAARPPRGLEIVPSGGRDAARRAIAPVGRALPGLFALSLLACRPTPPPGIAPPPDPAEQGGWPATLWGSGAVGVSAVGFQRRTLVVAGQSEAGARVGRQGATASAGPFVAALDELGAVRWIHALALEGTGVLDALAVPAADAVFVSGWFRGRIIDGPTSDGTDCLVGRLDDGGRLVWLRAYGGPGTERCRRLTVGPEGTVWVTGSHDAAFGTVAAPRGGADVMVLALDAATGELRSSASFGGGGDDHGRDLAVENDGGFVVAGSFGDPFDASGEIAVSPEGAALELAPSLRLAPVGDSDGFVAHFDPTGAGTWATAVAGPGFDVVKRILATDDGWLVAGSQQAEAPPPGVPGMASDIPLQAFVARIDLAGEIAWAWSDPNLVSVHSLELVRDRIVAVGHHREGFDLGRGAWPVAGGTGVTLALFSRDGQLVGGYGCDGPGSDYGYALATTPDGRIAFGGTVSPDGGCATTFGGHAAGFVRPMVLDAKGELGALVVQP